MRKFLFILLLFFGLAQLQATRYYIDPAGNNSTGDGSSGSPWATLAYACSQVSGVGDTIIVNAGTYNEGTNQIVKAVGVSIYGSGNTSIITSTFTHASALQGTIQCASASGSITNDNSSISYIKLDGNALTANMAIYVGYRSNVDVHHVTIVDFKDRGVWFYVDSDDYPALFASGNKVRNCVINNSSRHTSGFNGCIRWEGQTGFEVAYNTIDMTSEATGSNANSLSPSWSKKCKVHHNTMYRNNHEIRSDGTFTWNFFFEMWDYRGDCQYYNNIHYGTASLSYGGEFNYIDTDCTFGVKLYNNQFLNAANVARDYYGNDNTNYAIAIEGDQHREVYVYNNYIQRTGWGISLSSPSSGSGYWAHYWEWDGVYVYYNIIENVGYTDHAYSHGIIIIMELDAAPYYGVYDNIVIANNVITGNNGGAHQGYYGIHMNADGTFNGLNIKNNIVYDFAQAAVNIQEQTGGTCVINNVNITYNDFYSNGTDAVVWDAAVAYTNRDIATGNITGDPTFTGGSPYSYRLQAASPCIDAGVNVGFTSDYAGNLVPYNSVVDIGAYEYGSTITPEAKGLGTTGGRLMKSKDGKILVIQ